MTERIIISGFGGQGIMFLGRLIAWSAMLEDKFVTFLPAYGAEVRGGTSHCVVVISDREIASPCVDKIDTLIVMNKPSAIKFMPRLKKGSYVFANISMMDTMPAAKGSKLYPLPFTELASRLGNVRLANMVALGTYLAAKKILSVDNIIKLLPRAFKNKPELVALNKQALELGLENGKG